MSDVATYTIYRNKAYLRKLVLSLESKLDYILVRLCDMGITEHPTYAKDTELSYYLVDELKRHGFFNYSSLLTGIPHVLNSTYLTWVSLQIVDEEFKEALGLISSYLDCKERLTTLYDYDRNILVRRAPDKETGYLVKPLKSTDPKGRVVYNVKDFKTKLNTVSYETVEEVSLTPIYYKYFVRVTSSYLPNNWTFFQGMTREQEAPFIQMCLEGWLQPTNPDLMVAWGIYFNHLRKNGQTLYRDLRFFIEEEHELAVKNRPTMFVTYLNEYSIGFGMLQDPDYPIYLSPLIYSKEIRFELSLQLQGYGGEFTLTPSDYLDPPFPLKLESGETVKIYKKRDNPSLNYNNFSLDGFYNQLISKSFVSLGLDVHSPTIVTPTRYGSLYRAMEKLEKGGYRVDPNKNTI